MKRVVALALLAITASSFGQNVQFKEVKGDHEFSGELIARPMPFAALRQSGYSVVEATSARTRVQRAVAPYKVRYIPETDEYVLKVPKGSSENALASKLDRQGAFQYIEPNWTLFPLTIPDDPQVASQWHVAKVQAYDAWTLFTAQSSNMIVAITDTGVRTDHEDLILRLIPGANTATGTAVPQSGGGLVEDINGHGTHCAGIAAASGNNALGVTGMGWGLKIMPVRVTNSTGGSASLTSLTAAARWAAENGARVVSTSYSGVDSASIQTTGAYLRTLNVLYCYAAGNSNTNLSTFDHADVTIVGASDSADAKASFSSYGLAVDVFAPGVNILATLFNGPTSYGLKSGTSMATPLVAGIATTVTASNPILTSMEVQTSVYQGCDDLGTAGEDSTFGWGRVNLNKALRYAYNNYPAGAFQLQNLQGSRTQDPVANANRSDNVYFRGGTGGTIRVSFDPTLLVIGSLEFQYEDAVNIPGGGTVVIKTASGVTGQVLATYSTSPTETVHSITVPLNAIDPGNGDVVLDITYTPAGVATSRWEVLIDQAVLFTRPS